MFAGCMSLQWMGCQVTVNVHVKCGAAFGAVVLLEQPVP